MILEAAKQIEEEKQEKQKKKDCERESKNESKMCTAVGQYKEWKNDGKPTHKVESQSLRRLVMRQTF